MQTLTWYVKRLQRMSAREIAWRARGFVRDGVDRPRVAFGLIPDSQYDDAAAERVLANGIPLSHHPVGGWTGPSTAHWRDRLLKRADAIAAHRFTFFNLQDCHLGDPIDWNRDHETDTPAPMSFAASIDYRDARIAGDAKVVWEPSRHHQLVVLARAYRATGDLRYAREILAQMSSWLEQCPFGIGMQWRSPLELAIRVINWIWALDLIRPSGLLHGDPARRLVNALHLHVWDVARKYSRGSSANNHVIGEAAAVFMASTCLPGLVGAARWEAESRAILEAAIHNQTYPDGGSREQAFGYHVFVLQFLLLSAIAARRARADLSPAFLARLRLMADYTAAMVEGGPPPLYGDADDGYVLDVGADGRDPREWVAVARGFLDGALPLDVDAEHGESAYWLLERSPAGSAAPVRLSSRAFPDSGRYLLQHGTAGRGDAMSVLFDCGEFGFGAIAAHGHADSLAFTLRAGGIDVLIDPGTYDYFRYPDWRDYFRSTRAHNTIAIDGQEQSVPAGPFMWGARARSWCTAWAPRPDGGRVEGVHDGYVRLDDPVQHVRALDLDGSHGVLTITDRLHMAGDHRVELFFHFSEDAQVRLDGSAIEATGPFGSLRLEADPRLRPTLLQGSTTPPGGWVSRGYHRREPSTTVILSGRFQGDTTLLSRLTVKGLRPGSGTF